MRIKQFAMKQLNNIKPMILENIICAKVKYGHFKM